MFCTQCGHQLPDESRFCPNCGASIANTLTQGPEKKMQPNIIFSKILSEEENFPEAKKLQLGYVIVFISFIIASCVCLFTDELDVIFALIKSVILALIGVGTGNFLVASARKASVNLPPKQAAIFSKIMKKWNYAMKFIPYAYILSMIIAWFRFS